jgi:CheY-like chemotaxis protein
MARRKSILVADDSEADIVILQRAFLKAGINANVYSVRDGQEAIDYLTGVGEFTDRKAHPLPCLVLLDLKMPKLDGFDVLRWLEEQPTLKKLPVTVLTSSDEEKDVDRAYGLGANSYLVKPSSLGGYSGLVAKLYEYWVELNRPPGVALP